MKLFTAAREFQSLLKYWKKHPLASKDFWGTTARFFRWQIGSRLLGAPVVWPWIGGAKLVAESGMTGATMNIYCGLHEFEDMAFLLHLLLPTDRFVDVGANVGSYTVLAAKVCGASVTCIEPVPTTFAKLQTNLAVNAILAEVNAIQIGVGPIEGATLKFVSDCDTTNRVAPSGYTGSTVDVPIHTLDHILKDFAAIMWKVDVEGFEEEVLSSAGVVLSDPLLLAVQLEGESPRIEKIMEEAGFAKYRYDPFTRKLTALSTKKESHNWLWIRNIDTVQKRCVEAKNVFVNGISI